MDSKNKYLDFYKENFGQGKYCSKSWGLASYEAGQQSKQAEIDALTAELAKYQKDGYKLIPVEPSKEKLEEIEEKCFEHPDCFGIDCPLDVIYRVIIGEME